jgi:Bacterial Ig-like domain
VVVILTLGGAIAAVILLAVPRPLAVVEVSPAAGATDVAPTAQIVVTFSRPLDEATTAAAITIAPPVAGFTSVAGRRLAFTPRASFSAGTTYAVTVGDGLRDRGGRTLTRPLLITFRTRAAALVARTRSGLMRISVGAGVVSLVERPVTAFAVSDAGTLAYVDPRERRLVIERPRQPPLHVAVPPELDVRDLEWAGARALLFLGARADDGGRAFIVRLDAPAPAVEPFGDGGASARLAGPLVMEILKRSLVEVVYRRDSYAITPDRRSVIVRDRNWDFALVDLDGGRRGTIGPFLAVGNASPRGDALAVVDVDPGDPALRRRLLRYGRDGSVRPLSPPEADTHSPRFAHAAELIAVATAPAVGRPADRPFALALIDPASGARRPLTAPPPGIADDEPRWSADDAWIAFRRTTIENPGSARVWIVPVAGGEPRAVEPQTDAVRWMP